MSTIRPITPPLQFHLDHCRQELVTALRLVDDGPIHDLEFWEDLSRTLTEAFSQLTSAQDCVAATENSSFSRSHEKGPSHA